jgi:hypothetical protein
MQDKLVEEEGLKDQSGRLVDLVDEPVRKRIAQEFADWWRSVPRKYSIDFPLPAVKWVGDQPIAIGPGIELAYVVNKGTAAPITGGLLSGLGSPLLSALAQQDTTTCVLRMDCLGLIAVLTPDQLTVSRAIRRAKQVLQLALIVGAFETGYTGAAASQSVTAQDRGSPEEKLTILLPGGFASTLAKLVFSDPLPKAGVTEAAAQIAENTARREQQFSRIGKIVHGATLASGVKEAARGKSQLSREDYVNLHCARIVTACEWLQDSESETSSAMAYVQVAIGFEALYGGGKGEPVVETLANRVAYSLGRLSEERAELRSAFVDFYDKRSSIVHNGSSLLDSDETKQLAWGKGTLRKALTHELGVVGPLPGEDPEKLERTRRLARALRGAAREA